MEEEEVEAMEAVLQYCYDGDLCDTGDSKSSVTMLLRMVVLADRYGS